MAELDAATDAMLRRFAREVADLRREVKSLHRAQRPSQLGHSSIEDGSLPVNDAEGNEVLRIGKKADGVFVVEGSNGGQVLADIQPDQITETEISDGSISTPKLAANAVTAAKLEAVLALVTRLVAGDPDGARAEMSALGLQAFRADGTQTFILDAADGSATFAGDITGATIVGDVTVPDGGRIEWRDADGDLRMEMRNAVGVNGNHLANFVAIGDDGARAFIGDIEDVNTGVVNTGLLMEESDGTDVLYVNRDRFQWDGQGTDPARLHVDADTIDIRTRPGVGNPGNYGHITANSAAAFFGYSHTGGSSAGFQNIAASGMNRALGAGLEVVSAGAGAWRPVSCSQVNEMSDRRAKVNIHAPEASALDTLRQAPVYGYDYREEVVNGPERMDRLGVMANDLPDHLVTEQYGLRFLDVFQMVGLLTQAVQELDAEMDQWRPSRPRRAARDFTEAPLPPREDDAP